MVTKDLNVSYLLDFYGAALTQKQREVMEQYYNDDLSLAEIAANFGITRQGVRDAIKRGESVITELEDKIGIAKRYSTIQTGLENLERLAKHIHFENENSYAKQAQITQASQEMLNIINEMNKSYLI